MVAHGAEAEEGRGGTEIRCCVKYNTYFTTEIPIPSARSEIHRGAIKLNDLPVGDFRLPKRSFSGLHNTHTYTQCARLYSRDGRRDRFLKFTFQTTFFRNEFSLSLSIYLPFDIQVSN